MTKAELEEELKNAKEIINRQSDYINKEFGALIKNAEADKKIMQANENIIKSKEETIKNLEYENKILRERLNMNDEPIKIKNERNAGRKKTVDVEAIQKLKAIGETQQGVAEKMNISISTVRRNWMG